MTRTTALAGVLGISFSAIFVRYAAVSPATATFYRVAYALPALAILWFVARSRDTRPWRHRLLAAASGVLLAVDLTLFHNSIDHIGAGLALVLANTQVLFVGVAAWLLHSERPTTQARVVVPVILGGIVLLSGLGRSDAYGDDPLRGVLFGLGAGIVYAGFLIAFRASNRGHLAPSAGPLLDATAGATLGALGIGALFSDLTVGLEWPAHGWLLALALVVQTAGWVLISVALPRLPALDTSVLLLAQPLMGLIWAQIFFDEPLSAVQWTGAALVIGGVGLLATRGTVRVESAPVG